MLASVNYTYGPPDVLQLIEVEKPQPQDNEVLVRVVATTVNRTDCGFRQPEYLFVRFVSGLFKPKNKILGSEFAGIVAQVGSKVTKFNLGDEVFGLRTYAFGTHAEYVCLSETGSIALKPKNMSFNEAAAVCDGLFLANTYIKLIDFKKQPKLLINGATGSIGIAGLQLAKLAGADITAVCNTKNLGLIQSLGATKVIDYTKDDFTKIEDEFDVIFDAVGKSTFFKCKHLLKPNGIYFSTELGPNWQNVWLSLLTPLFGGKKVSFPIPKDTQKDIENFKYMIEARNYKAIIDRTYAFNQITEATNYVEQGEKTGNVVIEVSRSNKTEQKR